MVNSCQRRLAAFVCAVAMVPAIARGQAAAGAPSPDGPFAALLTRLKPGQTAIVINHAGQTVTGKVTALSAASLVLAGDGRERIFASDDVATIKKTGPVWDGALKGGTVGLAMALLASANCRGCRGTANVFANLTLGGAMIGLVIDEVFGPKTVYRAANAK